MPNRTFAKQWSDAKKAFTAATGRKKPSEKILRFFRQSSGLEEATADLDKAINKMRFDTLGDMDRPLVDFITTRNVYVKTLQKAMDRDNEADSYKAACAALKQTLVDIKAEFLKRKRDFVVQQINDWHGYANWNGSVAEDVVKQAGLIEKGFGIDKLNEFQDRIHTKIVKCQEIYPKFITLCTELDGEFNDTLKTKNALQLKLIEETIIKHRRNAVYLSKLEAKSGSNNGKKQSKR